jgi:hypothetical protein
MNHNDNLQTVLRKAAMCGAEVDILANPNKIVDCAVLKK